jgi:hypothetical protein
MVRSRKIPWLGEAYLGVRVRPDPADQLVECFFEHGEAASIYRTTTTTTTTSTATPSAGEMVLALDDLTRLFQIGLIPSCHFVHSCQGIYPV